MDSRTKKSIKKEISRGSWTAEEDEKLAEAIEIYGPKKWTVIAAKAGVKRCGKSCRLRWLNYLRPNIKRGHISDQEEDLILRLHKLLGNRWSLIAGRLPGRTDNEIKNYWNSYLSKKKKKRSGRYLTRDGSKVDQKRNALEPVSKDVRKEDGHGARVECSKVKFDVDDFFDFSDENPSTLEWVNKYLEGAGSGLL
ncbi:hypothetical protein OSB04_004383 [Centaurea solstitialis]|uniref:Uncharacterized protein n=1 Tax=Centaurea solstitialis TaxID=347529 RepID=A0AA38WPP5_9ASTR|nr:hypothetical protein OSB04_004383 [Centaurea solstitialis]